MEARTAYLIGKTASIFFAGSKSPSRQSQRYGDGA
jgi:hypothetical protein